MKKVVSILREGDPFDPANFHATPPVTLTDGPPVLERLSQDSQDRNAAAAVARAERLGNDFCMPTMSGLATLGRMVGHHLPAVFVAMAAVREHVAYGRTYTLTAAAGDRLGLTRKQRLVARERLEAIPEWFSVTTEGNRASTIRPTPEAIRALHHGGLAAAKRRK